METNSPPPTSSGTPNASPHRIRNLAILTFVLLLVPLLASALVFPLISQIPYQTVGEIAPADIRWLSVRLLNRTELDGGEDVGPFYAAPEDFAALLAPLKQVPEAEPFPDARGPWLGEYRVMRKDGRRITIRLYWQRSALARPTSPAKLRFQLGSRMFEGGSTSEVIAVAEAAQSRGRLSP